MPYYDVNPDHPHFLSIQRIGACGLLKGVGEPYLWANRTWFYPDSLTQLQELVDGLESYGIKTSISESPDETITTSRLRPLLQPESDPAKFLANCQQSWRSWKLSNFDPDRPLSRMEVAVLLDQLLNPFHEKAVDFSGLFLE